MCCVGVQSAPVTIGGGEGSGGMPPWKILKNGPSEMHSGTFSSAHLCA